MNIFRTISEFLFPIRKEELYFPLKKMLCFKPHHIELYKQALLHKSMFYTDPEGHHINNERLEFLGDAIIEAIVSNYLFRKYSNKQEGFLTTMRSKMVCRSALNQLSKSIGLDNLVKASISTEAHNSYIGGNAFEALFGAAYLDRGYRCCQRFFISLIERDYLNLNGIEQKEQNFKSRLLEWCQKNHIIIKFETTELNESIDSNKPPFVTTIIIEDHLMGQGFGFSKKESHQKAAHRVIQRLKERQRVAMHILEDRHMRMVISDIFQQNQNIS